MIISWPVRARSLQRTKRVIESPGHNVFVDGNWSALVVVPIVCFILYVLLWGTIGGLRRAATNGDQKWTVAIATAWFLGLGWLVGWIYMATHPPTPMSNDPRVAKPVRSRDVGRGAPGEQPWKGFMESNNVGSEIVKQARRANLPYGQVHAATQVEALLRKTSTPTPQAWFFAKEPEHLVVMFAPDFLRRFQGASWWADLKVAPGDGFGGDLGTISNIKVGGVVYNGVEPQSEARRFVDRMRLHHLPSLAPAAIANADRPGETTTELGKSPEMRLARLKELFEQGLITEAQLDERTREILREI